MHLVFWVFLLSIQWEGRSLFDRSHEILVENPLVEVVDEELRILWEKISSTAESTYAEFKEKRAKEKEYEGS